MIGFVGLRSLSLLATRFLPALFGSALRASVVFCLVYAVTAIMKNTSPRPRHLLWLYSLLSYPAILVLLLLGPYLYLETAGLPLGSSGAGDAFSSLLVRPTEATRTIAALVPPAAEASVALSPLQAPPGAGVSWWWPAVLLAWVGGAWLSYAQVVIGRTRLRYLTSTAQPDQTAWETAVSRAPAELRGSLERARILSSVHSRVPFTCGVVRPLIVLPADRRTWTPERLSVVLRHEAVHVRRRDVVVQEAARTVCALFWFVPFVWIAYNSLSLEQETACDSEVVAQGVERRRYATCLLEAARASRDPVHLPGLVFPRQRRRILEERIRSIVRGGGKVMKSGRAALAVTAAAVSLIVLASCVHVQTPIAPEEAWGRFVGTWENLNYSGKSCRDPWVQKVVIPPDSSGEDWTRATDTKPAWQWKVVAVKKTWTDWRGRTYGQFFGRYPGYQGFVALYRVSKSGEVLEINSRSSLEDGTYPEDIDPKATPEKSWCYFIYYRK